MHKPFPDLNFKIAVLESVIEKFPEVKKKFKKLHNKYYDEDTEDPYGAIPECVQAVIDHEFTKEELESVTLIYLDGGSDMYMYLTVFWDGEDELFDIKSFEGFENLPNLKKITAAAMYDEEVDWKPLEKAGIEIDF